MNAFADQTRSVGDQGKLLGKRYSPFPVNVLGSAKYHCWPDKNHYKRSVSPYL